MRLDPAELSPKERYKLMIGLVVPRPVAWVSTVAPDGARNLAPFSYFNAMQASPFPVLALGVGTRGTSAKDTLRNIEATREFVVSLPDEDTLEAMNATSADHAYGVDEFDVAGVEAAPSDLVRPPRVAHAPASFECRLFESIPLTRSRRHEDAPHGTCVLGEVVRIHVRDDVVDEALRADVGAMRPVARLGGPYYWRRGEVVRLDRPTLGPAEPSRDG